MNEYHNQNRVVGGIGAINLCQCDACDYIDVISSDDDVRVRHYGDVYKQIWHGAKSNPGGSFNTMGQFPEPAYGCDLVVHHYNTATNTFEMRRRDVETGENIELVWTQPIGAYLSSLIDTYPSTEYPGILKHAEAFQSHRGLFAILIELDFTAPSGSYYGYYVVQIRRLTDGEIVNEGMISIHSHVEAPHYYSYSVGSYSRPLDIVPLSNERYLDIANWSGLYYLGDDSGIPHGYAFEDWHYWSREFQFDSDLNQPVGGVTGGEVPPPDPRGWEYSVPQDCNAAPDRLISFRDYWRYYYTFDLGSRVGTSSIARYNGLWHVGLIEGNGYLNYSDYQAGSRIDGNFALMKGTGACGFEQVSLSLEEAFSEETGDPQDPYEPYHLNGGRSTSQFCKRVYSMPHARYGEPQTYALRYYPDDDILEQVPFAVNPASSEFIYYEPKHLFVVKDTHRLPEGNRLSDVCDAALVCEQGTFDDDEPNCCDLEVGIAEGFTPCDQYVVDNTRTCTKYSSPEYPFAYCGYVTFSALITGDCGEPDRITSLKLNGVEATPGAQQGSLFGACYGPYFSIQDDDFWSGYAVFEFPNIFDCEGIVVTAKTQRGCSRTAVFWPRPFTEDPSVCPELPINQNS